MSVPSAPTLRARRRSSGRIRAAPGFGVLAMTAAGCLAWSAVSSWVWPRVVGALLGGVVLLSACDVLPALRLHVEVTVPERVTVGGSAPTTVRLVNRSLFPVRALAVVHRVADLRGPLVEDVQWWVEKLPGRGERTLAGSRRVLLRGVVSASDLELRTVGPFALLSRTLRYRVPATLRCRPGSGGLPTQPELSGGRDAVGGVREWRPGDAARDLHWRSTLRVGRPLVVQRDAAAEAVLGVIVVASGGADFEDAVRWVAALGLRFLNAGGSICLVEGDAVHHSLDRESWLDLLAGVGTSVASRQPRPQSLDHLETHVAGGRIVVLGDRTSAAALERRVAGRLEWLDEPGGAA